MFVCVGAGADLVWFINNYYFYKFKLQMLEEYMGPLVVYFEGADEPKVSDLTKRSRALSTKIRGKKLQKNLCLFFLFSEYNTQLIILLLLLLCPSLLTSSTNHHSSTNWIEGIFKTLEMQRF